VAKKRKSGVAGIQVVEGPVIDEEFRKLIPPLSDAEYDQLEANIRAEKRCRDPLVLWSQGGLLLDGHNRVAICETHDIPYDTVEIDLPDRTAAKLWIIDNQSGRRNISDIDRIKLAREREKLLKPVAQRNRVEAGKATGRGNKKVSAILPKPLDTRREAAKAAGVGERTYDAGKLILDAADKGEISEETVDKVRRGEAAIHRVAKEIKTARQQQHRATKRAEAAKGVDPDQRIVIADFREPEAWARVPAESVSLIFTDPPYDRKAESMLVDLARFGAEKLAGGGSMIFYLGHHQLPAAFDAFGFENGLRFWWPLVCHHTGRNALMREYGVRVGWKPMLWYVKGTRDNTQEIVSDVMNGSGEEKEHHDWQQGEAEARYWIGKLCPEDGLVCDPFLGGGTTAAAAEALKRPWIAFESDPAAAATASRRIAK